ncbi:leucine-rich repeat-containing protein 18 [Parambassis ranga]|uniref:Leucine-rich repeat-containing protein 18 n=1 Tax=Parambassis ranga TaxID=210632 RepID=A0A6P7JNG3_9TELE|nr:leucine-rich repeat-containing protein 18-like [Parambassis ranga]
MPKGKGAKGIKVTLKSAKKAVRMTPDGWRRLTLSNMGLTIFPKCLLELTNVDELDLSRNLIQELPDNIGNFSSLKWLDLHSNKLKSLPESIGNLVGLTHLNFSNNNLTAVGLPPALGHLTNLRSLNLGMNQLDALPPTLRALDNLQELGLFDNLFNKLPEFVQDLGNLTKLNVKRNPLLDTQEDDEGSKRDQRKEGKWSGRGGGGGGMYEEKKEEEKKIRTYSGLMVPNSVATVNQDVWRLRKKGDYM